MREQFTEHEWELLKRLHFQVFGLVAGSDGVVDRKERSELERQLLTGEVVTDPLHRLLLTDLLKDDSATRLSHVAPNRMPSAPKTIKAILRSRLTDDEYRSFIGSLFSSGLEVARASGSGPLGLGPRISSEERAALLAFAVQYELDAEVLARQLGVEPPS